MPSRLPFQARVAFAVAASIIPGALLSAALVGYDYYDRERARLIRDTTGTARALVAGVDGKLEEIESALFALGTSPYLQAEDFRRFHAQATAALKNQEFVNIVLIDAAGRQRVNTVQPFGAELPVSANPVLVGIAREGRPGVTEIFQGPLLKRWLFGVGVPVSSGAGARYSLNAGILPERMAEILNRQHLPPDWVAAVFDAGGAIVARTHQPERFVGTKGAPLLVQRMKEVAEGAVETETLEGTQVLSVFSRSPASGWSVAIGIPRSELLHQLWSSMGRLAIVAFVLMGTSLGLAVWIGGRLAPAPPR